MTGTFNKSLPSIEVSGVATQDITGSANIVLPSILASGSVNAPLPLASITLSGNGLTGTNTRSGFPAMRLKPLSASGIGLTNNNATSNIQLPKLLVSGNSNDFGLMALKPILVVGSGKTGANATGVLFIKPLTLEANAVFENLASANLALKPITTSSNSASGEIARLDKAIPKIGATGQGLTGTVSTSAITLPVIRINADGVAENIGSANIALPALQMMAQLAQNIVEQNENSTCYVMNGATREFTEYKNFNFNSFAKFNGRIIGANNNGIYELTGADDDGEDIAIKATFGILNMGSDQQKRLDALYFWHKCDNDLNVRLYLDGEQDDFYDYTLEAQGQTGNHANRVKLGKGMKASYYQLEVSGIGTNLELDALSNDPFVTARKIR